MIAIASSPFVMTPSSRMAAKPRSNDETPSTDALIAESMPAATASDTTSEVRRIDLKSALFSGLGGVALGALLVSLFAGLPSHGTPLGAKLSAKVANLDSDGKNAFYHAFDKAWKAIEKHHNDTHGPHH